MEESTNSCARRTAERAAHEGHRDPRNVSKRRQIKVPETGFCTSEVVIEVGQQPDSDRYDLHLNYSPLTTYYMCLLSQKDPETSEQL